VKKYYYLSGSDRVGPVTLEELKLVKGLTSETLLWYEGLVSWLRAGDISELSDVLTSVPPPVPAVAGNVAAPPVPPNQSSRELFAHPFSFKGRIRRLEFVLSGVINLCVTLLADFILGDNEVFSAAGFIYWTMLLTSGWFWIAQGAKRSHDFGKSGWWLLLYLGTIPNYVLPTSTMWLLILICYLPAIIFALILLFHKGDAGDNVYGPDPRLSLSSPPPLPLAVPSSSPPPLPNEFVSSHLEECERPDFRLEAIRCLKSAGKSFDENELNLKIEDLRAEYLKSEGSRRETKRSFLGAKEDAEQEAAALKLREDEEKENRHQRVFVIVSVLIILTTVLIVHFSRQ
jgi:uncharacterized membrane protein YhaH (DUF805 family)